MQGKWSARWISRFTPTATGTYRFSLDSARISKLFIDGREVLSNFGQDRSAVAHSLFELKARVPIEVWLDYVADLLLKREIKVQLGMLEPDPHLLQQAVEAARNADVAIVFVFDLRIEGGDTPDLSLPGNQDRLIEAVAGANPRTVVVINTGGPALMPWLSKVSAVVEAWYPGQENGRAISRILFGDANPAGRLPITFPQSLKQTPAADPTRYTGVNDTARYEEGLLVGYRWYDAKGEQPLFPFGYGLSYTKFGYGEISAMPTGASAKIKVHVSNAGSRDDDEVVHLYLQAPQSAGEPPRVLKAFQRIVERLATVKRGDKDGGHAPEVSSLPERLRAVLALVAQGLSDDEIAAKLTITRNTVRNHVSAIYKRLGIRKRSAVVVWARERGLGASPKPRTMPGKVKLAKWK